MVLLLCGFLFFAGVAQAGDGEKKYKITVDGGYAQNVNGADITEAAAGELVYIYCNRTAGTYVKDWKTNQLKEKDYSKYYSYDGLWVLSFVMPEKDVTFTAVTAAQKEYVIDLKDGSMRLDDYQYSDSVDNLIEFWLAQAAGEIVTPYYGCEIDLDKDGTKDIALRAWGGQHTASEFDVIPLAGCSVSGEFQCEAPCEGPLWPFIIRFGAEPVKEKYSITVNGGKASDSNGKEITQISSGSLVILRASDVEGSYVKGWSSDGGKTIDSRFVKNGRECYEIYMPAKDMVLQPVLEKQTPYLIDLTKGNAEVSNELYWCVDESWGRLNESMDLDGDGTADVTWTWAEASGKEVFIPLPTCSISGDYTLTGHNFGEYWPITIRFGEVQKDYSITVKGGHAVNDFGDPITRAEVGQNVVVVRDSQPGEFWKEWKADFDGFPTDRIITSFVMPAKDVTITAVTVTKQTPITIDLTDKRLMLWDKNDHTQNDKKTVQILTNAISSIKGYYWTTLMVSSGGESGDWMDLDGNGTWDIGFGETFDPFISFIERGPAYSLGASYSFPVKDGAYGPIILVVDEKKTDYPLPKWTGKVYSIGSEDCIALNEKGETVTEARSGEKIHFRPKKKQPGMCLWNYNVTYQSDGSTVQCGPKEAYVMPESDIAVTANWGVREARYLDLRDAIQYEWDTTIFPNLVKDENEELWRSDLNGDGKPDIEMRKALQYTDGYLVRTMPDCTEKAVELQIEDPDALYSSVTIMLNFTTVQIKTYVDNKQVSLEGIQMSRVGTYLEIRGHRDVTSYDGYAIRIAKVEYCGKPGVVDEFPYEGGDEAPEVLDFAYPAVDGVVAIYYESINKPTPTVTPTPTMAPTKEPTQTVTEEPTPVQDGKQDDGNEDKKSSKEKDSDDGISPLLLIIPAVVLVAGIVTLIILLRKRKGPESTEEGAEEAASVKEGTSEEQKETSAVADRNPAETTEAAAVADQNPAEQTENAAVTDQNPAEPETGSDHRQGEKTEVSDETE